MKRIIATLSAMAMMTALAAFPALAQPQQRGLVNVTVGDVTILEKVGVGVAANVCGVQANVLAQQIAQTGTATCEAVVEQEL